ncbi:hypothetical protein FKR81_06045 [Lentzea tibetensis]|uniref:Exo-alpha-sialidase n=1 Tax=Lentzea tibetensis TaxID=2591470 RepID=A0A563F181_9PSEU|nr:glycoside hydrolase [Lentzea tibetensis]TWP53511.1 hypothetical protein FKR81_06045 [Lentzea tibetensis]
MRLMVALLLALLVVAPPVHAAPTKANWENIGPNGVGGRLAFSQSRVYVLPGAGQHVFRSDDRGKRWFQGGYFPGDGLRGNAVTADPRRPDTVYVAGYVGGGGAGAVLRSTDGGATFKSVLDTPSGVEDVAVGSVSYASSEEGVYRSTDGVSWKLMPGSPKKAEDLHLVGSDLFVAAGDLYAFRGGKWSKATSNAEWISSRGNVVVTRDFTDGVQLSKDRGRTWTPVKGPWSGWTIFGAITASGQMQVQTLDGHFVSDDLGTTWRRTLAMEAMDVYDDLGSFPDDPSLHVVSATGGVYTTRDSVRFQRIGVPGANVLSLAATGNSLIAGTYLGSHQTTLPGDKQDWGFDGTAPPSIGNRIGALAVLRPGVVLRGRNAYRGSMDRIFLEQSVDAGKTWVTISEEAGNTRSISVDPVHPMRVYVGAYLVNCFYVSDDGGVTLQPRIHNFLRGVKSVAADDGGVWVGDVSGLYRSSDGGVTMIKVFDGVINAVLVDPRDDRHVVVLGNTSTWTSFDGKTFTETPKVSEENLSSVAIGPDGVLYAAARTFRGTSGPGVLRSVNGGRTWSSFGGPNEGIDSLLVSPDGRWLFAGTQAGGVHRRALR